MRPRWQGFLAAASAIPLGKYFSAHQHSVNVRVTNVIGPPVPVYVLGARILDILPITRLFGNVGLTLCAFSYAGQISLVVTADATAFPDLDVLMAGMEQDWHALIGAHSARADRWRRAGRRGFRCGRGEGDANHRPARRPRVR